MKTPWQNEQWFTSPWNFEKEALDGVSFAKNIQLHDISLRDGEQQSGIIFNKDQKIALAEKMAEMGMHRIEAGMPAVSQQDEDAIKEIVKRNLGPDIFAFCRCAKDDIQRAADCGVKNIVVEIPSSEFIIKNAYQWDVQKAIDLSVEATQFAKELGLYTVFFPIDSSRAEMNWFLDMIETVAKDGHMDALACVDTVGGLSPSAVKYLIKSMKARIKDKPIEVHFHDDYGLGVANTVLALAAGADVAHTTISGIGERAGNVPYEAVAMTLLTMYDQNLGLKYDKIYGLSKFLRDISGMPVRPNEPIIGDDISKIESGIGVDWYKKAKDTAPLVTQPYLFGLTGHPETQISIGKFSGMPTVDIYLDQLGIVANDLDEKRRIVMAIKEKAYQKSGLLTVEEFETIARNIIA